MAGRLADVTFHSGAVDAFRNKVDTEAAQVASVDWIRKFPEIATKDTDRLVLHAAILLRAQADLLNLAHVGGVTPAHIPDPFKAAIAEVRLLAEKRSISPGESSWHIAKFERERTEAKVERHALSEWLGDGAPVSSRDIRGASPLMQIGKPLFAGRPAY